MPTLKRLISREVLDSRGQPTVEVEAFGSDGSRGRAIVPSGASTGRHEAVELRDSTDSHFDGRGVRKAVEHVSGEIAAAVLGGDLDDQAGLDARLVELDGSRNKSRLGANAILGVSLAVAHAAADAREVELYVHLNGLWRDRLGPGEESWGEPALPLPMVNMISGGLHAGGNLDFQDFLVVPLGASSYGEALEHVVGIYRSLAGVLKDEGEECCLVGDEGGYGPKLRAGCHAAKRILQAALVRGHRLGVDVGLALDVAASGLFDPEERRYELRGEGLTLDSAEMVAMLTHWAHEFPIVSIEDGLAEDDWEGWTSLTEKLGDSIQLIGDDLFATQTERLRLGIENRAANTVLVKLNQVGTLSETLETLLLARRSGYRAVISARSGETEDSTIADLAVATAAGQIKIGSVARSERLAKYNRLLRIEEQLGPNAPYAGRAAIER